MTASITSSSQREDPFVRFIYRVPVPPHKRTLWFCCIPRVTERSTLTRNLREPTPGLVASPASPIDPPLPGTYESRHPVRSHPCITDRSTPTRNLQEPMPLQANVTTMNYREYFQGAGPFGEAPARHDIYQAIYTLFTEADGDRLLPLLLDIFNAQAIGGLSIFHKDAAGVDRLRVIHGLRRYPGTITQPSANRGRAFGYIDDVEGQEGELVQADAALLSRAAASRVYLLAHHEATISQHPDRDYIPAIPEGTDRPHRDAPGPQEASHRSRPSKSSNLTSTYYFPSESDLLRD
eukprot:jgi/Psemu1/47288/gm1.47288_g